MALPIGDTPTVAMDPDPQSFARLAVPIMQGRPIGSCQVLDCRFSPAEGTKNWQFSSFQMLENCYLAHDIRAC
jgi:hypothetical protein